MANLTVDMPNRPKGEEVEVQGVGWRAVVKNGETVDVPELEEDYVFPVPPPPPEEEEEEVVELTDLTDDNNEETE